MGLQLRVRHSLGARIVEVEARGPDHPIRIGRDGHCDVQVPSGLVAPTQAYLYLQEGQWVIADAGSPGGTFVNGHLLTEPCIVNFGDTISLGAGAAAPRIEVDPLGAARRDAGERASASAATRPSTPHDIPETPLAQMPAQWADPEPAVLPAEINDAEAPPDESWSLEAQAPLPPAADEPWNWGPAPSAIHRRPARHAQGSHLPAAIVLASVILATGAFFIYKAIHNEPSPAPAPASGVSSGLPAQEPPIPLARKPRKNIFDSPGPSKSEGQSKPAQLTLAPAIPHTKQAPSTAPADPRKLTDEWRNVESAHDSDNPVHAIWTANDYMKLHPGQFDEELHAFISEALDQLWWQRIKDLCNERDRVNKELDQNASDISAESPGSDFLKTLREKRMELQFQKNAILDILANDMAYSAAEIPNPFDDAQIARLRGGRDMAKYEAWCKRVLVSIQRTREAPWVRAR